MITVVGVTPWNDMQVCPCFQELIMLRYAGVFLYMILVMTKILTHQCTQH